MKKRLLLLTFFCAVGPLLSAQKDFFSLPSIKMGQKEYQLKWSAKTKTGRYLEEFLQSNEPFPKFECKVIVECSAEGSDVQSEVNSMMALLGLKKEQNIVFSFEKLDESVSDELWIEYVQGNVQGGQPFTLEWNINRYRMVDDRVVLLRVSHRVYDKSQEDFDKVIEKKREEWISDAKEFDLSNIHLIK